jgi:hypothetical protein
MKILAIILASIAALSATAQTYYIWSGKSAVEYVWAAQNKQFQRRVTCRSLLLASAEFQRLSKDSEKIVMSNVTEFRESALEYIDEEEADLEKLENRAVKNGRRDFLQLADQQSYGLTNFVSAEYLYFSDLELKNLGFDTWSAMLNKHAGFSYYGINSFLTDDEFGAYVAAMAQAGELYNPIKEVCAPILLDKA